MRWILLVALVGCVDDTPAGLSVAVGEGEGEGEGVAEARPRPPGVNTIVDWDS